jgi:hypothetical protein
MSGDRFVCRDGDRDDPSALRAIMPLIVRYSRVLWLHWERAIDPEG